MACLANIYILVFSYFFLSFNLCRRAQSRCVLDTSELLTRMKVRITFSLLRLTRTRRIHYTRARLSRMLESITAAELAGINFHNIWQVDTPREGTDPASGNDHSCFVLCTSSRNKCRHSIIAIIKQLFMAEHSI